MSGPSLARRWWSETNHRHLACVCHSRAVSLYECQPDGSVPHRSVAMIKQLMRTALCGLLLTAASAISSEAADKMCRAEPPHPLKQAFERLVERLHNGLIKPIPADQTIVSPKETRFGWYGYRHQELHDDGVIKKLMLKTRSSCCDGGKGGECRVTAFRFYNSQRQVFLDGVWCPVSRSVTVHTDIDLPQGAFGVACASKSYRGQCPAVYCAAKSPGA